MKKLFILLFTLMPFMANAQLEDEFNRMKDIMNDVDRETEMGVFTLHFFDAEDGSPIENATVTILNIGDFQTDIAGMVTFPMVDDNTYTFKFSKQGYITVTTRFEVVAGDIFNNRFTMSKLLDIGQVRVVLDWGSNPSDLDIHLEKVGAYHISYHDKRVADDRSAVLDRDDMDGHGPETITITDLDENATYNCFVNDYTNRNNTTSQKLAKSKARITIYTDNSLYKSFEVNKNMGGGTRWDVFQIKNGEIIDLNRIAN